MRVLRRPLFIDLTEAYAFLAEQSPSAANRFMDEVDGLIDLLAAFPEIGRSREHLGAGIRSFRVRRFRHLLFYRRQPNAIVLLRILHGARDIKPGMV